MKIPTMLILLTSLLGLCLGCASIHVGGLDVQVGAKGRSRRAIAVNGWELAYAHDKDGRRTAGDINRLIEAVEGGREVRLVVQHEGYEFITPAENLWVKGGIVYAQSTHVSSEFRGEQLVFVNDSYYWMFNFSTTGYRDLICWNVGEHKQGPFGHSGERVALQWYVR